jgi:hypothetical protein
MNQQSRDRLYQLLPAIYQIRDAAEGEPLKALLAVIEQEVVTLEEDIGELYDNWFIETCIEWAIPYIGDLLDVRALYASSFPRNQPQNQLTSPQPELSDDRPPHPRPYGQQERRAYVANTLAYRRRKGTTAVLEQLVRDVTGWRARAIEFSRLLLIAQNLNHPRTTSTTVDLRNRTALDLIGTPFEQQAAYTAEIRRASQGGEYNVPNMGIFVWRLQSYPIQRGTACVVAGTETEPTGRFYTFNPLGYDNIPLFNQPQSATDLTKQAQEINVPAPLRYAPLVNELAERQQLRLQGKPLPSPRYFNDSSPVLQIFVNGQPNPIPPEEILVCRLAPSETELAANMLVTSIENQAEDELEQEQASTKKTPWQFPVPNSNQDPEGFVIPTKVVAVDPELGRIAFLDRALPEQVEVNYLYGFSDDLGGGPYSRGANKADLLKQEKVQYQSEDPAEPSWINPLYWEVEQDTAPDENPLDTAIQTWNQTVSAWQALQDQIHIPLARITIPPVQVSQDISKHVLPPLRFNPGIVGRGLEVLPGCCPTEILITPGLAIDRQARRLQVYQIETIDLNQVNLSAYPNPASYFILVIRYQAALQGASYRFDWVPEIAIRDDGYPEGMLIPLIRFRVSTEKTGQLCFDQPDRSVRSAQFSAGIVQGLEVKARPGTFDVAITPGIAVDQQGQVFTATSALLRKLLQSLKLENYQGATVDLVLSHSGQRWQLNITPSAATNPDLGLRLARLSIPKFEIEVERISHIEKGLTVYLDADSMKVKVAPGQATDFNNQEIIIPREQSLPYPDQTSILVLCTGIDSAKGKRGSINIVDTDAAFTNFENYLPLAMLVLLDQSSHDAELNIYPVGQVLEGLDVSATSTGISITPGTARDGYGQAIKLTQTYKFDLRSYTARQLVLFICRQKKQGFPLQPIDPPTNQDWQQLGIVPQVPDPADTGIILIKDSQTYTGDLEIMVPQERKLKVIAADGSRPHICGNVWVQGTAPATESNQGKLILEGLLIAGQLIVLPGYLQRLQLIHSTLLPEQGGLWVQLPEDLPPSCVFDLEDSLTPIAAVMTLLILLQGAWSSSLKRDGIPEKYLGQLTHLVVQQMQRLLADIWQALCPWTTQIETNLDCLPESPASGQETGPQDNSQLEISLYHSICGAITLPESVPKLQIEDSILDKKQSRNDEDNTSGLAIFAPGTDTEILTTTVLGMTTVRSLVASNSLFTEKVIVRLNQTGCIRFSYVPEGSQTPPRYQCQPDKEFQEALDPIPSSIAAIASQGDLLFCGSVGGGVFRFIHNGQLDNERNDERWGKAAGLTNPYVATILFHSVETNTVFVGTMGGRIFRSQNNGGVWVPLTLPGVTATVMALCQYQETFTLAATAGNGILRGTVDGENWRLFSSGLTNHDVRALVATQTGQVFAGTAGGGIFQMIHGEFTDESEEQLENHWKSLNNGLKNYNVSALATDPDGIIVFAGTVGGGVFRLHSEVESDQEMEWIPVNQDLSSFDITALVTCQLTCQPNLLIAATADGKLFRSLDQGEHWDLRLDLKGLDITALAANSSSEQLFAGTAAGAIYRSTDAGKTWQSINTGLPSVIEKLLIMDRLQPTFTSERYGDPGYAQLSQNCANELRTGAEDGAEMGTFNSLKQPQREANLQANLEEYLRFGLEAGIFYAT